jgi:hypothetical protein
MSHIQSDATYYVGGFNHFEDYFDFLITGRK